MTPKKFKWTAIFLIKGAADNLRAFTQMLDQLATTNLSPDVAVVLCINIRAEIAPTTLPLATVLGPNDTLIRKPGWTTLFCNLESVADGNNIFNPICESREFRMDKEEDITVFFKQRVLSQFAAERYILFTWDHGQPFGIFPDTNQNSVVRSPLENLHLNAFHFLQQKQLETERLVRAAAPMPADDALPMLTATELKQAIQWAFDGQNLDVLVMSNCFLQFFDTGYELSRCTDYLVTFETIMYFNNSFNYKNILQAMADNSAMTPETLSKIIVNDFAATFPDNAESRDEVALFANDLSWYPALARMIDRLAGMLTAAIPDHREKIFRAASKCEYISPGIPMFCLLDFRNLVVNFYHEMPELIPEKFFNTLIAMMDQVVVSSFIGKEFLEAGNLPGVNPSGFSIYFPIFSEDYRTSFLDNFMTESSLSPTEFIQHFGWDQFIKSYIQAEEVIV
jgi:hypothetical protein